MILGQDSAWKDDCIADYSNLLYAGARFAFILVLDGDIECGIFC